MERDSQTGTDRGEAAARIKRLLSRGWAVVPGAVAPTIAAIEGAVGVPRPTRKRAVYEVPRWLAEALER